MLAGRIVERDFTIVRKVWLHGWIISSLLMPVLFLAAMGVGLGGVIDEHQRSVGGVSYLHFVAPGLLVASVMQQAAGDSMWPVLGGVKWDGRYLAMVASPLSPDDVHLAMLLWVAIRNAVSAVAFLLVAAVMGGVASPWAVLAIPAAVLCGSAFCALLSALAIRQENDTTLSLVYRLGIMPVFLFSGSFFPISVLPTWLQPIAWVSPLWHGVELARHACIADPHWGADVMHLAVLVGVVALG